MVLGRVSLGAATRGLRPIILSHSTPYTASTALYSKWTPQSRALSNSTANEEITIKAKVKSPFVQAMGDYASLSKFRLSALVVVTAGAGFIAAGHPVHLVNLGLACTGTALCAASASTFNQIFEIENDKLMKRTKTRPLPMGRISVPAAGTFGTLVGVAGTSMLYSTLNPIVAALGLANIFLYSVPYTFSKRYTELNTWIGSLVGAIPPIMGWAAATNGAIMTAEPWALGAILFLWQFPHFFALSWLHREDYGRGGFQMVGVNDPDGSRSSKLILEYSIYLTAFPFLTSLYGLTSYMFAFEGIIINGYLLHLAKKFHSDHSNANARKIFLCSLWYLPVLLAAYVFHSHNFLEINQADEENDSLTDAIAVTKEKLKGFCMHEVLVSHTPEQQLPQLCPVKVAEKTSESVTSRADDIINENKLESKSN